MRSGGVSLVKIAMRQFYEIRSWEIVLLSFFGPNEYSSSQDVSVGYQER